MRRPKREPNQYPRPTRVYLVRRTPFGGSTYSTSPSEGSLYNLPNQSISSGSVFLENHGHHRGRSRYPGYSTATRPTPLRSQVRNNIIINNNNNVNVNNKDADTDDELARASVNLQISNPDLPLPVSTSRTRSNPVYHHSSHSFLQESPVICKKPARPLSFAHSSGSSVMNDVQDPKPDPDPDSPSTPPPRTLSVVNVTEPNCNDSSDDGDDENDDDHKGNDRNISTTATRASSSNPSLASSTAAAQSHRLRHVKGQLPRRNTISTSGDTTIDTANAALTAPSTKTTALEDPFVIPKQ